MKRLIIFLAILFVCSTAYARQSEDGIDILDAYIMEFYGISTTGVSNTGMGKIYFDVDDDKFKASEDGGAFVNLVGGGAGYTDLTEFVDQTAWRVFYSDGSGDVQELAFGADGTYLRSNGATSAPTFTTPAGSGDMTKATYDTDTDDDIDVAAGGTEKSSWTQYCIPYLDTTTSFSEIAIGTANEFLAVNPTTNGYVWKSIDEALDFTFSSNGLLERTGVATYGIDTTAYYYQDTDVDHNQTTNYNANEHFLQSAITTTGTVTSGTWNSDLSDDVVDDADVNWGTSANQVSAVDVPIADGGGIITATDVEAALQENRTAIDLNTAKETNATHDGDVTGSGTLDITESVLGVGGSDTIFPADPNADRVLWWDDAPTGELLWKDFSSWDSAATHASGDGSDHADVATNTTHSGGDGSDHADVATNTTKVTESTSLSAGADTLLTLSTYEIQLDANATDTKIFIANGAATGNWQSVSGDGSLTNGGVFDITESVLGVGQSDTIFPADPNADKVLMKF